MEPDDAKYYTPSPELEADCNDMPKLIDGVSKIDIDSRAEKKEYGTQKADMKEGDEEVSEDKEYYTPSPELETDCDDMPKLIDGASKTGVDIFTRSLKECEIQNLNKKEGEQEFYNSQPEYYTRPNFGEGDYFGNKQKLTDYASKIDVNSFASIPREKEYGTRKPYKKDGEEDVSPNSIWDTRETKWNRNLGYPTSKRRHIPRSFGWKMNQVKC